MAGSGSLRPWLTSGHGRPGYTQTVDGRPAIVAPNPGGAALRQLLTRAFGPCRA